MTAGPGNRRLSAGLTVVHRRIAVAIQNVTADLSVLAAEPQGAMRVWRTTLRDLSVAARVLHEQAAAIGMPDNWIEHAHQAGRLGHKSTTDGWLPAPTIVSRPLLLAQLHHQTDTLFSVAAIGVVRRHQTTLDIQTANRLSEQVRLQWLRVGLVATAIELTEAEVGGWWATDPSVWQPRMARLAAQVEPERGRQWRELTGPATLRESRARVASMRMVGIDLERSALHQLPPAPHLLETAAENAWHTPGSGGADVGVRIGAAIDATGIDQDHNGGHNDSHDLPPPIPAQSHDTELGP